MICWFFTFLFFLKFQISNAISYFNCSTLCCCIWWKGEKTEVTQPWWSCLQETKRSSSQFFLRRQTPADMHFLKACYVFLACHRRKSFWRSNGDCGRRFQLIYFFESVLCLFRRRRKKFERSNDGCGRRFRLIHFFWKRVMFLARRRRKQFGALIVAAVGGSSWNTC